MALDRDIHAKGFSRLDKALAVELDGRGEVRLQDLGGRDPEQAIWGNALRARARELEARGLATEVRRNVMTFKDGWTETLAERSRVDITKTRSTTKLHERGEELVGEVVGLERRATGNSVLILDTGNKTKTMVNTKSPLVDHLQKGSWVHVDETGHLSRLSYHPLEEQLAATAFTALDRELDRIGHGEERNFTGDGRIDQALASRAQDHVRAGLGTCDQDGVFSFHDGAKDALQGAEINALRETLAEQGRGTLTAPGHTVYDGWRVGSFEELHAGRVALLERASGMGNHVVMVPTPIESAINIGDNVSLSSLGRGGAVQVVQDLSFGYGLGR
jgi:hypothetical protein